MPRIRFHYLRHTSATLLIHAGEHPQVIQSRLGRSNITTTMNTYAIFYKKRMSEKVLILINYLMKKIDSGTFLTPNKKLYMLA
ncbi:tyrosine-type recombinase/integrase [Lysinibacillus capsici]|uniref:tyrosine-type recombinase/integrase n=1 Tax=Lysinibacillus capsici TaxID=2115968 RepID=UPI003F201F33